MVEEEQVGSVERVDLVDGCLPEVLDMVVELDQMDLLRLVGAEVVVIMAAIVRGLECPRSGIAIVLACPRRPRCRCTHWR